MSHKLLPRLGSAIASTILSYAAVSLVGVDKAQAAVLTYNFQADRGEMGFGSGSFKVSDSSLTRTGLEQIAVSEGRFNNFTVSKNYYDLAGAIALFFQGEFRGLQASGSDGEIRALGGPYYTKYDRRASWSMNTNGASSPGTWTSYFSGYIETIIWSYENPVLIVDRTIINDAKVSYTLVNTEAEPVPEPLTAGTAAVALAGLSWLKHKKKMAG
ncbi:hypothetical protein Q5692_24665 [Microcoleus sp. C2C3]|uniref:hypothetical protein n=1 Tax=unclassified Microcoleus TaxID=2642155 RepID=UPI002FD36A84